jgi:hypothetical protein
MTLTILVLTLKHHDSSIFAVLVLTLKRQGLVMGLTLVVPAARPKTAFPHELLRPEMSDTGLTVSDMHEPLSRYDVTVTVARDGGYLRDPVEFAAGAEQAALSRNASVVSAHTAEQIISVVTVQTADSSAAVAVALGVVSDALRRPAVLPSR